MLNVLYVKDKYLMCYMLRRVMISLLLLLRFVFIFILKDQ